MVSLRGRGTRLEMPKEAFSQSSISNSRLEMTPFQDSIRFSSHVMDGFSLEEVLAALLKDFSDLLQEACAYETELNHLCKQGKTRRSRSNQGSTFNSREIEYKEILTMKGNLLEKITATIDKMDTSTDIPKAKIHCYLKYASLLRERVENIDQEINQLMEGEKKTKQECEKIDQQLETFKKLMEDEESSHEGDDIMQLFQEAKRDLNTVMSALYPEKIKDEFTRSMAELTEALMSNDNEEDQYVEFPPESLQNSGIRCLIQRHVIIEHPSNPARYRLNMVEV